LTLSEGVDVQRKLPWFRISLSDKAFSGLLEQATNSNYIHGASRNRGLGLYMWTLIKVNAYPHLWTDTRPRVLRDTDLDNLEGGVYPIWDEGDPRRMHAFNTPTEEEVKIILNLAKAFGTIRSKARGGGNRLSAVAILGQFWEAVGLGWLTPKEYPLGQGTKLRKMHQSELDW